MTGLCQCEHVSHFTDLPQRDASQHEYLAVPAGERRALWVGPVCDACANGHLSDLLVADEVTVRVPVTNDLPALTVVAVKVPRYDDPIGRAENIAESRGYGIDQRRASTIEDD
jgi:hypothetical protein